MMKEIKISQKEAELINKFYPSEISINIYNINGIWFYKWNEEKLEDFSIFNGENQMKEIWSEIYSIYLNGFKYIINKEEIEILQKIEKENNLSYKESSLILRIYEGSCLEIRNILKNQW